MTYPNLHLLLHAANRRNLFVAIGRIGLLALGVLLLGVLLAVGLDAVFAFPITLLIAVDLALMTVLLAGTYLLLQAMRRSRFDPRRVARLIEQRAGLNDSALINALDLRDERRPNVSRALARQSVELGERVARGIDLRQVVELRPLARAASTCAVITVLVGLAYLLVPDVFGRGLPRLIDPTGDHPPFTLLKFDVTTEPEPLYYGSDGRIAVTLRGPSLPDRADVVMLIDGQKQRLPMMSVEAQYELVVREATVSRDYYIDTPEGRSDWYRLEVHEVPRFEDVWVTYQYPDYTDWQPRGHRLQGHDIEAIVGTRVMLEVTSNYPLEHAHVRLFQDGTPSEEPARLVTLAADSSDPRRAQGTFSLDFSGRVTLQLVGQNGVTGPETREARLIAIADKPPQVRLASPEPTALAVEGWKLPVKIEAADDVQLDDIELHFAHNEQPSESVTLENSSADRRRGRAEWELDLAKLGAKPGDEIRMFASATDTHPDQPQSADSPTHVIQVISQEEYTDYLRSLYQMESLQEEISQLQEQLAEQAQQQQQAQQALQELADQMQAGQPLSETQQQQLEQAQQQLDQAQAKTGELQQQIQERLEQPQLYDLETPYRERLQELGEQLAQQQQTMEQTQQQLDALADNPRPTPESLEQLQQGLAQMQQQREAMSGEPPANDQDSPSLEQLRQDAEKLQLAQQMMSEAQRIQQVMQQQRELADRLQPLRSQPSLSPEQQARADRLAREQELLDQQLREATDALRKAAEQAQEKLPKTAQDAQQLCNAVEKLDVDGDQRQCASSARKGQGEQAHESADRAADKLESLAGQCNSSAQGAAESDLDRGLGLSKPSFKQTLQQMAQAQQFGQKLGQGLGQRPGQSSGQGMGAQPGQAQGQRGEGGLPRGDFGLHGPQPPRENAFANGRRRGNRDNATDDGLGRHPDDDSWGTAEEISADSHEGVWGRAGNLRGVPMDYRDEAEAYFRRLSQQPDLGP